ncbi:MAG: glycosyltransferase [Gudongella sp.]|nr:glycosyltransferase [Gudongella sp.]
MNKVLIIANEFPPMGGAGVQRTTKFVKYLREFDFEPIVVTKKHMGGLSDQSLLQEIPHDIKIYRLKAYDFINKTGILKLPMKFIGTRILSPDSELFWYYFNRDKVLEIIKKEKIEIIYTTSFPYSSHLMGLYLRKKLKNIRWVVDFRDEWTNNPYHRDSFFKRLKFKAEKKKELEVTNSCDYFITNTPLMLEGFLKDNADLHKNSTFIPNGYDEKDFCEAIDKRDGDEKFVITYTGSLYGRRNLDEFLDGLKLAIDNEQIDKNHLEIRIVGNIYDKVIESYSKAYSLEGVIRSYGYLAHKESIQMLFNSDIILLVIGKGKGSRNFYTGKIFEYIRANRQILAIVPEDGVAADVIRETKTGVVVDPENIEGIMSALVNYYKNWLNNNIVYNKDIAEIEKYSRKAQTKKLAEIFTTQLNLLK